MLNILISLLGILITILLVVGIHEFGHFIVAKWSGIKVLRFSIGFGKALLRWHDKQGTEYVLAAIPLGGYVKMLDEQEKNISPEDLPRTFNRQPFYKKAAVIIAGPLSNLIFAFTIYWILFIVGFITVIPIIGKVTPHSIAELSGLEPKQEIVQIDHKPTLNWTSIVIRLFTRAGDKDILIIQTKNLTTQQLQTHDLPLTHWELDSLRPDPLSSLGIAPYIPETPDFPKNMLRKNQYNPYAALSHAWDNTELFTHLNFIILGKMVSGKISTHGLGGPITIFQSAGTALNHGAVAFLSFLAFLSISIGVINILPIPGLDGGQLLFQLIEAITRKPISDRTQALLFRIGMIFLLLIMTQSLVNDILRLH